MLEYTGKVIKKIADDFWVYTKQCDLLKCKPKGTLKPKGIFVGDDVVLKEESKTYIITKLLPRKNILIRPPIANLEQLVIVISTIPKPDFMILDKLLLFAYSHGIKPIIVVNKQDLSKELNSYINNVYSKFVDTIFVSAKSGEGIEELKNILTDKISAFAGQSAVGKSALINKIFENNNLTIEGELSERINRGKNTTRHCEIFYINNIFIADTAGFTSLDEKLLPIAYYELPYYYPDFNEYHSQCRYKSCVHDKENLKDCKIKEMVNSGMLDKNRYLRYIKIYNILKDKWVRTHG